MVALDSSFMEAHAGTLAERLQSRAWWRLLVPSSFGDPPATPAEPGWSGFERLVQPAETSEASLWIAQRSAVAACLLALVLVCGAVFRIVLGRSVKRWWLAVSILVILTVLAPAEWLSLVQLALLACLMAALVQLAGVVLWRSESSKAPAARSWMSRAIQARSFFFVWCLACVFNNWPVYCNAQEQLTTPGSVAPQDSTGSNAAATNADTPTRIFGILMPVDEDGQLAGAYAHIPTELWQLLSAPEDSQLVEERPRIISADYQLSMRSSLAGERETIQDLSVDMRIQVTQLDRPLRLPFDASEVELIDGRVKDREVLIGLSTLTQERDAVVFRPQEIGTLPVRLRFSVRSVESDVDASRFTMAIPPIASSNMKINFNGNSKFTINAAGGTERIANGELLSHLGPIARLDVSWTDSLRRFGIGLPVDIASETWVHCTGDQVIAACQLKWGAEQSLPQELHVNIDNDWEPIGADWGDAKVTLSEAFGSRRVYTVQRVQSSGSNAPQVIRVLLIPRLTEDSTSISLPFLSLQEVSQQSMRRVLAWSTDDDARWKPDGVDFWPEWTSTLPSWGPLALAASKRVFRVASGTGPLQLRRQPIRPIPVVNESTAVHLDDEEISLEYRVAWDNPEPAPPLLRLRIPLDATVESVLVDGKQTNYRISTSADHGQLLVPVFRDRVATISTLEVELKLATQFDVPSLLPRVVLAGVDARNSLLRLFRKNSVDCEIIPVEGTELNLEPSMLSSTMLLDGLEVVMGEIDLRDRYRDSAQLPLQTKITRQPPAPSTSCTMLMAHGPEGWLAHVNADWPAAAKLDFVYFDLPVSIRDNIDSGSSVRKFLPAADPDRTILCLIPRVTASGEKQVEFSFPLLSGVSNQSLVLPQVRLLSRELVSPILGLPDNIDDQPVRWTKAGRRLGSNQLDRQHIQADEDYGFYAPDESQSQVNWQPIESGKRTSRIENRLLEVTTASASELSGIMNYWIAPRGQLVLQLRVPASCQVLGVESGGDAAIWQLDDRGLLSITMQPNYLPIHVRLLGRWQLRTTQQGLRIDLPEALAESTNEGLLVWIGSNVPMSLRINEELVDADQDGLNLLIERWQNLLTGTLQAQQGLSPTESEVWLSAWAPRQLNLPLGWLIPTSKASDRVAVANENGPSTVADFWDSLSEDYGLQLVPNSTDQLAVDVAQKAPTVLVIPSGEFIFQLPTASHTSLPRWLAASFLALASLLSLVLATRLKSPYNNLLSSHPWIYWLQLGALSWLLLPVAWPSYVLALVSLAMLTSQLFDARNRLPVARRN